MTRLEANREILEHLSQIVESCPDWRFQQILFNFDLYTPNEDRFYEESVETLDILKKCMKV
jgi:hypothetical protein